MTDDKITVENVNHPGQTSRVDRTKYEAMNARVEMALPKTAPNPIPSP